MDLIENCKLGYCIVFYNEASVDRFVNNSKRRRVRQSSDELESTYTSLLKLEKYEPVVTVFYPKDNVEYMREKGVFDKLLELTSEENLFLIEDNDRHKQFKSRWYLMNTMNKYFSDYKYFYIIEDDFMLDNTDVDALRELVSISDSKFISLSKFTDNESYKNIDPIIKPIPLNKERGFRDGFLISPDYVETLFIESFKYFFKRYNENTYTYMNIFQYDDLLWLDTVKNNPNIFNGIIFHGNLPVIHCEFHSINARTSFSIRDDSKVVPKLEEFLTKLCLDEYRDRVSEIYNSNIKGNNNDR